MNNTEETNLRYAVQYIKNEMCLRSIDEISEHEVVQFIKSQSVEPEPEKLPSAEEVAQFVIDSRYKTVLNNLSDSELFHALNDKIKEFASLAVEKALEHHRKEWDKERESIMKNLDNHCDYVSLTLDGMKPEKAARECGLI